MFDLSLITLPGAFTLPTQAVIRNETVGSLRASLDGLTLNLTPDGLRIYGSIAKFYRGENVGEMTRGTLREAFDKLEAALGFSVGSGTIRVLEVGHTLTVDYPAAWYTALWEPVPRFRQYTEGNGLTVGFRNSRWSYQGYDKGRETLAGDVPELYRGRNLLRLELKLHNAMSEVMGGPLTVERLMTPEVYRNLLQRWKGWYFRIPKARIPRPVFDAGVKELVKSLAACQVKNMGGLDTLLLDLSKRSDLSKVQKSRARQELRDLTQDVVFTDPDELTTELDRKVRTAAMHSR